MIIVEWRKKGAVPKPETVAYLHGWVDDPTQKSLPKNWTRVFICEYCHEPLTYETLDPCSNKNCQALAILSNKIWE